MQEKNKKLTKNLIYLFAITLLFAVLRCLLMILNYNFETGFFHDRLYATALYLSFLVICAAFLFVFKNKTSDFSYKYNNVKFDFYANLLLSAVFVGIFTTSLLSQNVTTKIELFTKYLSLVTSGVSAFVYFAKSTLSEKTSKKAFQFLNLFPILFLIFQSILQFMEMSGRATTYNLFPNVFSLIILAFFVLNEEKSKILGSASSLLPISAITVFSLMFSVIPDVISICMGDLHVNSLKTFILALKLLYIFIAVKHILGFLKEIKEDV
ncbi:MAG: hypothetical protein E7582_07015 [Ruminococcaceae bacterium]|nr:hypothetical protein [Oscillospiraceae bacterium]